MDAWSLAAAAVPSPSAAGDSDGTGATAQALAARHRSRMGAQSRPLAFEQPACRRQVLLSSRIWPRRANAFREPRARARRTAPASSHFSRCSNTSSPVAVAASRSSRTAWQPRKRRRCAVSQALKPGLRSSFQAVEKFAAEQGRQRSQPIGRQRRESVLRWRGAISIASTKQSARSSLIVSPLVSTCVAGQARRRCT